MAWEVILLSEVHEWYASLDSKTAELVAAAIDLLAERGPMLGRPLVDTLVDTELTNLKELRPGSSKSTEIRILFIFDPKRQAVLLTAGNKSGQWESWYTTHISIAQQRYQKWLAGQYDQEEDI